MNRKFYKRLSNGLKLYAVKLVNGPAHGGVSICSGDIVWQAGENGSPARVCFDFRKSRLLQLLVQPGNIRFQ
jgi:hypothetical protein